MEGVDLRSIIVDSVQVQSGHDDGERFTIGSGVTRDFDEPMIGDEFTGKQVKKMVEEYVEFPEVVDTRVRYNLTIRAISKAGAKVKARTFVRAKHPLRIDFVDIESRGINKGMSEGMTGPWKYYNVRATVRI